MAQQNVSFIRPQEVVDGDKTEVRYRGYNGEQKIATSAWDASTGKVTIAEVTGAIAITATATAVNNG